MKRKSKRLTNAILETAKDFRDGGIIDEEAYQKITMRHLKKSEIRVDPILARKFEN